MLIHLTIENLDQCRREWHEAELAIGEGVQRGVEYGVREGVAEALATRKWKDRSGLAVSKTRGYVEMKVQGGAVGIMECAVPYASFLDSGSPPHDIWPKEGRGFKGPLRAGQSRRAKTDIGTHRVALRWYDNGTAVFARMVHHPGTKGDGFFARAYQKCERVLVREIELGVMRAQRILDS